MCDLSLFTLKATLNLFSQEAGERGGEGREKDTEKAWKLVHDFHHIPLFSASHRPFQIQGTGKYIPPLRGTANHTRKSVVQGGVRIAAIYTSRSDT